MPRLEAVYFGEGEQGERYARLARVLEFTARLHCPDWKIGVQRIDPRPYRSDMANPSHVWNTQKLEKWVEAVSVGADGERVLLIDGDMMILHPLDDVWRSPFDLAYTIRERGSKPLNGGVVFLRISNRTRSFMTQWWRENLRFLGNKAEHAEWRRRYAGINQASFGYVIEKLDHGCQLLKLSCKEWNCENTCWKEFNAKTRIVHIKSKLRRALFGSGRPERSFQKIMEIWRLMERRALRESQNGGTD